MSVTSVYYGVGDAPPAEMQRAFSDVAKYSLNEVEFSGQRTCEKKLQAVLDQVGEEAAPADAAAHSAPVIYICWLAPEGTGQVQPFLDAIAAQPGAQASVNSNEFRAVYIPADQATAARESLKRGSKIYALNGWKHASNSGIAVVMIIIFLIIFLILIAMPKAKPSLLLQVLFVILAIILFAIVVGNAQ